MCQRHAVTGRFAPGHIQRFLLTVYILCFTVVKLRLRTFIQANDDDGPAYSVKTQAPGGETSWGETSKGRTDERVKRP